jgi:protein TonB
MSAKVRTFSAYGANGHGQRQWAASLTASSAIYLALGVAAVMIGSATKEIVRDKVVDLTFVEKVVREVEPPKPVELPPPVPVAAAPVVRPDQKVRKLDKPPPPKELVAPKDMPTAPAAEADPSEDKGIAVYGEVGKGDPAGLEGGGAGGQMAVALPEDADPPMPAASNQKPPYPQEARAGGRTGTVVLKVVILADGSVANIQVMRGDEPFVSAAVATVKTWRYEPARFKGRAITVYRIIQIPFKLTA